MLRKADKANPAYIAIEQDTLSAVAPFLDLRKRDRAESSTTDTSLGSSPVKTQSYAHGHRSSNSIDLSSSLLHSHNRDSSVSSVSYEDFRNSMQIVPEADFANTQDNHTTHSVSKSPFRKLSFSYGRSIPGFTPYLNNSHTSPVPIRSSSGPTAFITQYPQMAANDYGIESVGSQHIEVLQNRLRSMSLGAQRSRKSSISSLVASGSTQTATGLPDAAFTLTRFLHDCVRQHSPSSLEIDEKLRLRKEFETILQTIQPTAQLVMFGSVENGLNLANADLDLMVVDTSPVEDQLHDLHSDLPSLYAEALRGQGYCVKLLAKTRIALIKIQREYLGGVFACDICFDNPLALHNTRLLATYAACDSRVPILMMFVKLWARSRKINDSFGGTLKSYGYLLLLIYYLQNKCVPALLPNLQMVASSGRFVKPEELTCLGYDVWYSKDAEIVPTIQQNTTSVGELLEGFFSHFAYEFDYRDVSLQQYDLCEIKW